MDTAHWHPCFVVTPALGNNLHSNLPIPRAFMDGHGGGLVGRTVDLEGANGRAWLATVDGRGFAQNWPAFARDNNFQPGDALLFTMVAANRKFTVRVVNSTKLPTNHSAIRSSTPEYSQSKGDESSDDGQTKGSESSGHDGFGNGGHGVPAAVNDDTGPSKKRRGRPPKQAAAETNSTANGPRPLHVTPATAARQIVTKRPSISVMLKPSAVECGFYVTIPLKFARLHLPQGSGPMTLRDTLGAEWRVRWAVTGHHGGICDGWRAFSVDHHLEVGDACVFEVLESKDRSCVLRVHIYRVVQVPDFVPGDPSGGCDVGDMPPPARTEGHSSDHELPVDDHAVEKDSPTTDGTKRKPVNRFPNRRQGEDPNPKMEKLKMKMRDEDL